MTSLPEKLLLQEKYGETSSESDGGLGAVQYAGGKETGLCRIGDGVFAKGEPAETPQPIASKTAKAAASLGTIRGRDLLSIALCAYSGWGTFCFLFGFVAAFYFAMVYGTNPDAFVRAASQNFYFNGAAAASFYFSALLAMRRVLQKRRGRGSFASYFGPIGARHLIYAALSGLLACGLVLLLLSVLWWVPHPQYHPAIAKLIARPHSLGHLVVLGLLCVVLGPAIEEMFFRGLLLGWLQPNLGRFPASSTSAAIFALWHFRFLRPGIGGWIATVLIAAMGLLCALWAQRTHSLRAPFAAHAAYNLPLVLLFSW